tara:strand:- start:139 stop:441 length:303 start_codon:yes stop_codon:yes gene_type:complete
MIEESKELFQSRRDQDIKDLFKSFLGIVEDLAVENSLAVKRLKNNIPDVLHPYIDQYNSFSPEKIKYIRKKILDLGNECLRKEKKELENFEIKFIFNNKS